ncbi:MAG: restriction endonuclease subunit S, partial [Candidatus Gracilibacteria bacterium]|nr:restriction endonuclease subunit S [Candidatus Gracilibacteria bacterium]
KNEEHKKYIYYFLHTINKSKIVTGSAQPQVTINNVIDMQIPLPPLPTQKLIVSEIEKQFSRLDYGLESLKKIKTNLKNYKASVLKSAVEGKLTEEWRKEYIKSPDFESANILLEKILKAKKEKFLAENPGKKYKEAVIYKEVNEIVPNGWILTNIGTILDFLTDYHANGSYEKLKEFVELFDSPGYALMIRSTNFEKNDFEINTKYISEYAYENLKKTKIYGGEILMSKIGNAGKVYLMPFLNKPCSLAMNLFMLRFNEFIVSKYIYYHLISIKSKSQIRLFVKGVGNPTIDKDSVRNIQINLPPFKEQQKIVEEVESRLSIIEEMENLIDINIKKANNLKQSILKKAFSGELI